MKEVSRNHLYLNSAQKKRAEEGQNPFSDRFSSDFMHLMNEENKKKQEESDKLEWNEEERQQLELENQNLFRELDCLLDKAK